MNKLFYTLARTFLVFAVLGSLVEPLYCQWMPLNGFGRPSSAMAVRGSVIYVGTNKALMYSTDSGHTWNKSLSQETSALATKDNEIFAASNGICHSGSNGNDWSWSENRFDPTPSHITALAVHDSFAFAGAEAGGDGRLVYRSSDHGKTWKSVYTAPVVTTVSGIMASGSNIFVSAESNGVIVSSDNGSHWVAIAGLQQVAPPYLFPNITCIASTNNSLFAVGRSIYRSRFDGARWSNFDTCLSRTDITSIFVHGSNIIAGTKEGTMLVSADNGDTWNNLGDGLPFPRTIAGFAEMGHVLFASSNGVFRSTDDGLHWSQVYSCLDNIQVVSLVRHGEYFFAGTFQENGFYRSADNRLNWSSPSSQLYQRRITSGIASEKNIWFGTDSGVLYSTNDGMDWAARDSGISFRSLWGISGLYVHDTNIYAGTSSGAFVALESNGPWHAINRGLPQQADPTCFLVKDSTLYVGLRNSSPSLYSFRFNDTVWRPITSMSYPYHGKAIDVMVLNQNEIFLGGDEINASTDGVNWTSLGSLGRAVQAIACVGSNIFVATGTGSDGVKRSSDRGQHWESVQTGLPTTNIYCLDVHDGKLFAGTSDGVWYRPFSEMIGVSAVSQALEMKKLVSVYPNPTTSSATISLTPEASSYAEISIVNMLGQIVARVYSGVLDASEHTFTWETQAKACATPGMYECVVRMNGRVKTVPISVQ